MDHVEAREVLEIAAAEPGGLERLMAGDTIEAGALAGHLVGCGECTAELGRLRRIERLLRGTVAEIPPPELRERTLAFVRAVGRDRSALATAPALQGLPAGAGSGGGSGAAGRPSAPVEEHPEPIRFADAARDRADRPTRRRVALWVASIAATVAISVLGTAAYVGGARDAQIQRQQNVAADLASIGSATLELMSAPDARLVNMVSPNGTARGLLVFAPSRGQVVVTASGLSRPAGTWTYRCWASVNGQKRVLGWMHFESGLAYWAGPAQGLASLGPGTQFGVSLVDGSASGGADVVLQGTA